MPTVDLSRLSAADYRELALHWMQTAKTPACDGRVNPNGTLALEGSTDTLRIELCIMVRVLNITLHGFDAGHWVELPLMLDAIPAAPLEAYAQLLTAAEEIDEVGFVRRHKRFFLAEWKHFIDLFPVRPGI